MADVMAMTAAETAGDTPWPFHRKIDFIPAKRQFTGFSNGGGGFRLETLNPTKSDPDKQEIGQAAMPKKRPDPAEPKEQLDPKLGFGFSNMKIGAGLYNLGNTCYLNSVLQCLTYTEPLAAFLQSGRHKSTCRRAGFCALCAIQNHVSRALQSTGKPLAPNDLVSNLRCISRNFRRERQEDAHEYMVNLLESMHKCCLPSGVPSESPSAFEKSLVHQIFGGRLRSQVKCMQCSFCSDKFDPFLDLSLEINKADSLQKALAHFTAKEYLDGGAREYHCQRCKQKVKALKQLSIHKAPNVLSIHLKRFGCHQPGQKIDKKVHFGPTLDLKPFVSGAYDGDLKYTLYGVLVHNGWNTHSGHYYCFVRTASGIWHSLDDSRVNSVSEKTVLDEKAYMLFYVRDFKSFIPKKPVDVGHAKSMILNAMGNQMQSSSSKVPKDSFQNSPTSKKNDVVHPSALTRIDVLVAGAPKDTLNKEKSIQETLSVRLSLEKKSAIANGFVGGLNNVAFVATSNDIDECKKGRGINDNSSDLVVASSNIKCLKNSVDKNYSSEVSNKEKTEEKMSNSLAIKAAYNVINSSSVDSRIKDIIPTKDCGEKGSRMSNSSSQGEEPSHVNIQLGGPLKKRRRESKKKFSKRQITMTRLSSGLIFKSALNVRKKIHKKVKKIDNSTQEHLGPSTSEPTLPLPITLNSRRKGSKVSSSKSENILTLNNENGHNDNFAEGVVNEKLSQRAAQNGDAVAADESQKCRPSSHLARNDAVGVEGNILKENVDSKQNGIMNMVTRGLKETIVARWDEMEHPSSQIIGRSGEMPVTIGYIGDDWDEEYDKGKRKKLRTSITEFGGPNPFQEIATKKAKFKKAKLDRSSSANKPFRI